MRRTNTLPVLCSRLKHWSTKTRAITRPRRWSRRSRATRDHASPPKFSAQPGVRKFVDVRADWCQPVHLVRRCTGFGEPSCGLVHLVPSRVGAFVCTVFAGRQAQTLRDDSCRLFRQPFCQSRKGGVRGMRRVPSISPYLWASRPATAKRTRRSLPFQPLTAWQTVSQPSSPRRTVTARPPRWTRSPPKRTRITPPWGEAW
jgi:hypothetical protein